MKYYVETIYSIQCIQWHPVSIFEISYICDLSVLYTSRPCDRTWFVSISYFHQQCLLSALVEATSSQLQIISTFPNNSNHFKQFTENKDLHQSWKKVSLETWLSSIFAFYCAIKTGRGQCSQLCFWKNCVSTAEIIDLNVDLTWGKCFIPGRQHATRANSCLGGKMIWL